MTQKLKHARIEACLKVSEVASLAGVDKAAVSKLERGLYPTTTDLAVKVAKALGLDASWAFKKVLQTD